MAKTFIEPNLVSHEPLLENYRKLKTAVGALRKYSERPAPNSLPPRRTAFLPHAPSNPESAPHTH